MAVEAPPAVFRWPVRVYWEDTDAGGIVYHASYLRFMERARTEWLRAAGLEQSTLTREHGLQFTVVRLCIDYRSPARYDDRLEVGVAMTRHRSASFEIVQEVTRDAALLCRAVVRIACIDRHSLRPRPMPAALRAEFARDA